MRMFQRSEDGSMLPIFALSLVPLVLALGVAVDYTSAVATRSSMQNALDAAILSLTTLPRTATDGDRRQKLQEVFAANDGAGTTALNSAVFDADGTFHASATADFSMPTNFMKLALIRSVPVEVSSSVTKKPSLVQATFKIEKASGYWDKTITLYGTKFSETTAIALMQITYVYNKAGGAKGYGTTTVLTPDSKGKFTVAQQKQVCTSTDYSSKNPVPSGSFVDGTKLTACAFTVGDGSGATIDVSQMNDLYLQMDVPSGTPKVLKSNDPNTSDRLFLDGVEVQKGMIVDIFTAVPCGQLSHQAWEDGGSSVPGPVSAADFFYSVTGKCDYSQRVTQTRLTS